MASVETVPIAVSCADGTVTILRYVIREMQGGVVRVERTPTDEDISREVSRASACFDREKLPVTWARIAEHQIPTDRTYRNAWRLRDGEIVTDMDHARRLHLDAIRHARARVLEQLDRDWMRAMGQGKTDEASKLERQRQTLRDLPETLRLEDARTTDELKTFWPAGL
jgi:hypothetical protein